jgi:hypothetical protein
MALGLTLPLIGNENQESYWTVKRGRRLRLTTLSPSVNRLFRKCGKLDASQTNRLGRPVTRIALLFTFYYNSTEELEKYCMGRPYCKINLFLKIVMRDVPAWIDLSYCRSTD